MLNILIFEEVRNLKTYILSLVIVIMTPILFNAVYSFNDEDSFFQLVEKEDQEKKETEEKKEEVDDSEEYVFDKWSMKSVLNIRDLAYFTSHKCFVSIDKDVLIEPPEKI